MKTKEKIKEMNYKSKRNCIYPGCNRISNRYTNRWKNYFCSIHYTYFNFNGQVPNHKKIAESILLTRKQALADVRELIEELKAEEKDCMDKDNYEEQEIEHINQIEMANKILKKLK